MNENICSMYFWKLHVYLQKNFHSVLFALGFVIVTLYKQFKRHRIERSSPEKFKGVFQLIFTRFYIYKQWTIKFELNCLPIHVTFILLSLSVTQGFIYSRKVISMNYDSMILWLFPTPFIIVSNHTRPQYDDQRNLTHNKHRVYTIDC